MVTFRSGSGRVFFFCDDMYWPKENQTDPEMSWKEMAVRYFRDEIGLYEKKRRAFKKVPVFMA